MHCLTVYVHSNLMMILVESQYSNHSCRLVEKNGFMENLDLEKKIKLNIPLRYENNLSGGNIGNKWVNLIYNYDFFCNLQSQYQYPSCIFLTKGNFTLILQSYQMIINEKLIIN